MDIDKDFTAEQVVQLLKKIELRWIPREKNREFKDRAGIQLEDIYKCVRNLQLRHFYSGPLEDDDPNKKGKLYIFKTLFLYRFWVYIKVKIKQDTKENKFIAIISFHD